MMSLCEVIGFLASASIAFALSNPLRADVYMLFCFHSAGSAFQLFSLPIVSYNCNDFIVFF